MRKLIYCLLFVAFPVSASTKGLDSLRYFFNEVQTYNARFDQVVLDEGLNPLQETSGVLWIKRPGKFRWEYDPPYEQLIVGDGDRVWVYDIDLEQITTRKMSGALGGTPAILLAGKGDLDKDFKVKALGTQGRLDWVQLIPKKKDGGFEDIRIGFEEDQIRTLELIDSFGQVTRITLYDFQENSKISKERFVFKPPEGIDVISDDE